MIQVKEVEHIGKTWLNCGGVQALKEKEDSPKTEDMFDLTESRAKDPWWTENENWNSFKDVNIQVLLRPIAKMSFILYFEIYVHRLVDFISNCTLSKGYGHNMCNIYKNEYVVYTS